MNGKGKFSNLGGVAAHRAQDPQPSRITVRVPTVKPPRRVPRRVPIEFVDAAGARIRVRTGGAPSATRSVVMALDPPNVLEHDAQPFIAWSRSARLTAFEPPGFGHSTAPRGHDHSVDAGARVVTALLERLALPPSILVFPCLTAYVALRIASQRPDLVAGLVLVQAPSWEQERAWAQRVDKRGVLRTPGVGQAALLFRGHNIIDQWYATAVPDEARAAHMAALANETLDHGAKFPLAAAFQSNFPLRGASAAAPLEGTTPPPCPTLLVWGSADKSHRKSDPASMRAHAPDAELLVMDDAGHFPELEKPIEFRDALVRWMDARGL